VNSAKPQNLSFFSCLWSLEYIFLFLNGSKRLCPNLLIKKKIDTQLINGKPGENHYNQPQTNNAQHMQLPIEKANSYNLLKPQMTTTEAPLNGRNNQE
jgi:hypothetical protein